MGQSQAKLDLVADRQRRRQLQVAEYKTRLSTYSEDERKEWSKIVTLSFEELSVNLRAGHLTCVTVLHAFQHHALIAHERTNCITEFLDDAEEIATNLDELYGSSPADQRPPMFGIPFDIKEQIQLAGHDQTLGFVNRIDYPLSENDAAVVTALRNAGAVPFVRVNMPQGLVLFNSSNPVYGRTTHPLDPNRTSGGSSGGNCALISMSGSPLGIGTDGGGSVRLPASWNGLASLKPTMRRVSQWGIGNDLHPTRSHVNGISWGPICPTVAGVLSAMKVVLSHDVIDDPHYIRKLFDESAFAKKDRLKIAYYNSLDFAPTIPAMRRVLDETKRKLEEAGHELVPWTPPDIPHAVHLFSRFYMPDAGAMLAEWLKGDIVDSDSTLIFTAFRLPMWLRSIIAYISGRLISPRAALIGRAQTTSTAEYVKSTGQAQKYRAQVLTDLRKQGISAILCPPMAHAATSLQFPQRCPVGAVYTFIYNLLDMPAGTVPIGSITKEDEERCREEYPTEDRWDCMIRDEFSSGSVGLPVGVQVVGMPNQEECVLGLMKEIETLTKSA